MKQSSKFSFLQVHAMCLFFVGVIATSFYLLFHNEIKLHTKFGFDTSASYVGIIFISIGFFGLYQTIPQWKKLSIDSTGIQIKTLFSKDIILKDELEHINLFARDSLGYLSYSKVNGIFFLRKNGSSIFIADQYYRNSPEIKEALQKDFPELVKSEELNEHGPLKENIIDNAQKFSDNFLLSLNGVTFIAIVGICLFLDLKEKSSFFMFPFSIVFCFVLFGFQAHYFILSSSVLEVRNQLWFWKSVRYNVSDIEQVVVESNPKRSNDLRINFKDYRSKKYYAGSLRDDTWKALLNKFNSLVPETNSEVLL